MWCTMLRRDESIFKYLVLTEGCLFEDLSEKNMIPSIKNKQWSMVVLLRLRDIVTVLRSGIAFIKRVQWWKKLGWQITLYTATYYRVLCCVMPKKKCRFYGDINKILTWNTHPFSKKLGCGEKRWFNGVAFSIAWEHLERKIRQTIIHNENDLCEVLQHEWIFHLMFVEVLLILLLTWIQGGY